MSRAATIAGLLVLGCTEYDLHEAKSEVQGGDDTAPDSAPPVDTDTTTCRDFEAPGSYEVAIDETCLNEPEVGSFNPVVEWQWDTNPFYGGYDDIMSTPAIANLTDDDGDGDIDEDDIPDIVFTSFTGGAYTSSGTVTAISGDGSGTHWSVLDSAHAVYSSSGVAIGDLEGDGSPDVC
ncbi:MAG: FG-GAP-like repeat-containing protein, partial [Myxococcota bacterium]|nr:FG-GAP-like repeat-containing protein [Myxococcota bacterium]